MNRQETGEFLYRFYIKRTASFLVNIYKASITSESKDIHRARLDVKKIFALYGLFDMLDPRVFRNQPGYKLFRPLYRQAGKIREMQVNSALLAQHDPLGTGYNYFKTWLREEEQRAVQGFLRAVKKFSEPELKKTDRVVRKICYSGSKFNLLSKTESLIISKTRIMKDLQSGEPGDREIHRIRQNLKEISTITTLVYSIKPVKQLDLIITALNRTEMMIGDWHDRLVLKEDIDRFLKTTTIDIKEELNALNRLKQTLIDFNQKLIRHFMPEVFEITEKVHMEGGERTS